MSRVLRSKWLSMGPEVAAFESEFAEFLGVRHAVAVANGTAALHLAYLALGIRPGDEIIQPAMNFVAAANVTIAVGAVPVFADVVSLSNPTIHPDDVASLVTPSTRAVVAMHYGGHACQLDALLEICRQHGLALVEDACHAPGAHYRGDGRSPSPMLGTLGKVGCFSFFSNKNLAVGEGGMLVTNDDNCAERTRQLRSHGMTTLTWDRHQGHASTYDVVSPGFNYRTDEIHAALGRAQLAKLAANNQRRRELLSAYQRALESLPGWIVPFAGEQDEASHLMVLLAPNSESRQKVVDGLTAEGIQTSAHYPCIPDFVAYERWRSADVGIAREYASRVITLPLFPTLALTDVERICGVIRKIAA